MAGYWVPVDHGFFRHWKTTESARMLGVPVRTFGSHIITLWHWAANTLESGIITCSDVAIAEGAEWPDDPMEFVAVLRHFEWLKFVESMEEDGERVTVNAWMINNWDRLKRLNRVRTSTMMRVRRVRGMDPDHPIGRRNRNPFEPPAYRIAKKPDDPSRLRENCVTVTPRERDEREIERDTPAPSVVTSPSTPEVADGDSTPPKPPTKSRRSSGRPSGNDIAETAMEGLDKIRKDGRLTKEKIDALIKAGRQDQVGLTPYGWFIYYVRDVSGIPYTRTGFDASAVDRAVKSGTPVLQIARCYWALFKGYLGEWGQQSLTAMLAINRINAYEAWRIKSQRGTTVYPVPGSTPGPGNGVVEGNGATLDAARTVNGATGSPPSPGVANGTPTYFDRRIAAELAAKKTERENAGRQPDQGDQRSDAGETPAPERVAPSPPATPPVGNRSPVIRPRQPRTGRTSP